MAVGTEVVARRYEDIVAGVPISVDYPLYEATDVLVYYGKVSLLAVYNLDYTVTLGEDFDTFTLTPTASLLTKINNLIAVDDTEVNYITVRRRLDYLTDTTAAAVRYTPFTSREFERTVLRFQQIQEQLNRALVLSPNFVGDQPLLQLTELQPGASLRVNDAGNAIEPGPQIPDINAQFELAKAQADRAEREAGYAEEWAQSSNPISAQAGGNGVNDRSSKWWAQLAEQIALPDGLITFGKTDGTYGRITFNSVAGLKAGVLSTPNGNLELAYAPGAGKLVVVEGQELWAQDFRYEVAASDATDVHIENAGGVKLYVLPTKEGRLHVDAFGATGTGLVDDSPAIAACFAAKDDGLRIDFADGKTYLMNSGVTKAANDIDVRFGKAKFLNGGAGFLFTFGTRSDTPLYSGLKLWRGEFDQVDPDTTQNLNYISIRGFSDFMIWKPDARHVSNGGIQVEAGCEDGEIYEPRVEGQTSYFPVCRAIWLMGSTSSDYAGQLVDTTSITRNATALPVYAAKRIKCIRPKISGVLYGYYMMNTRDCEVIDPDIDISGHGGRCIAINNYSPGARIVGGVLRGDQPSTGILITQCADQVLIDGVTFKGTFGSGRDISVVYLAEAVITNCRFFTDSTSPVDVNTGGFAVVENCKFIKAVRTADYRCVILTPVDLSSVGTGTFGNTATVVGGVIFRNNIISGRGVGVFVNTSVAAANGNRPATFAHVNDNTFLKMDTSAVSPSEYPLLCTAGTSAHITRLRYEGNVVQPITSAGRNRPSIVGAAVLLESTQAQIARFTVVVAAAGGAITTTKQSGAAMSLTVTRSGTNLLLTPRSIEGSAGAEVVPVLGFSDLGATIERFGLTRSGSSYLMKAFDAAGAAINFTSAGASFDVTIGPVVAT